MSDKEERLNRADKREQNEKTEEKRGFRILSQVVALILCLLIAFTVWLIVNYNKDKANEPAATGGEAYAEKTIVTADL